MLEAVVEVSTKRLEYASAKLRNDREVAAALLECYSDSDKTKCVSMDLYLSTELRADKELMMQFVTKNGLRLEHLELRSDEDVARATCESAPGAIKYYLGDTLTKDQDYMLRLVQGQPSLYRHHKGDSALVLEKTAMLDVVKQCPS